MGSLVLAVEAEDVHMTSTKNKMQVILIGCANLQHVVMYTGCARIDVTELEGDRDPSGRSLLLRQHRETTSIAFLILAIYEMCFFFILHYFIKS